MRGNVIAVVSLAMVLTASTAFAQKPATDWTGFYLGGSAVFRGGHADTLFEPLPDAESFEWLKPTTMKLNPGGVSANIFVGTNREMNGLLVGLEGDVFLGHPHDTAVALSIRQNDGTFHSGSMSTEEKATFMASARARAGKVYLDRQLFVYGTGGIVIGSLHYKAKVQFLPEQESYGATVNNTKPGWTIGGGVEFRLKNHFNDRLRLRAELRFMGFGAEHAVADAVPADPPYQIRFSWPARWHDIFVGVVWRP